MKKYSRWMATLLASAFFANAMLPSHTADAGTATLTVLDSTGATKTFQVVTNGGGFFVSQQTLCDFSAAAFCAAVDASNNLQVKLGTSIPAGANIIGAVTQSGTWTFTLSGNPTVTMTDGTNNAKIQTGGTTPGSTDNSLTVIRSPVPVAECPNTLAINQITSTDLHTMTNKGYICTVILVTATAQSVSLVEGTGSVCATGTTGIIGGTTASMAFAANGGVSAPSMGTQWKMTTTADHLCLLQSSTGNVSGTVTYADHT